MPRPLRLQSQAIAQIERKQSGWFDPAQPRKDVGGESDIGADTTMQFRTGGQPARRLETFAKSIR